MALQLVKNDGCKRTYRLQDGRLVCIIISEFLDEISITDASGKKIGRIELRAIDDDNGGYYQITWMYMDMHDKSYKHKGVGREALKFFKDWTGSEIGASEDDGIRKDDGSHLTEDAPVFVRRMREEGVITK